MTYRGFCLCFFGASAIFAACGGRTSDSGFRDPLPGSGGSVATGGSSRGGSGGTKAGAGGTDGRGGRPGSGGTASAGFGNVGAQPGTGDCCSAHSNPGCTNEGIKMCVCATDPYCCNNAWDEQCVLEIENQGCARCANGTGGISGVGGTWGSGGFGNSGGTFAVGGSGGSGGAAANCCSAHEFGGCSTPSISECVCKLDSYCCTNAWDVVCVSQVEAMGCGKCPDGQGHGGVAGAGATGGFGGAEACVQNAGSQCEQCLCKACYDDVSQCFADPGCLAIADCADRAQCSGIDCYRPATCKGVIDAFGGPSGTSMRNVLDLYLCSYSAGCDCD